LSGGNEREFIDFQQSKEKGGRPMKCPLIVAGYKSIAVSSKDPGADCLKEECAWWFLAEKKCAILDLAISNGDISDHLLEIKDKMPHEG